MKRISKSIVYTLIYCIGLVITIAVSDRLTFAQADESPENSTIIPFDTFELIVERNMFDPNRKKKQEEREAVKERPASQIDVMTLVGTLLTDEASYAFFNGTLLNDQSVLKAGDHIADGTISAIDSTHILLEKSSQPVSLKVGMSLMRENQGEWTIADSSSQLRTMMAQSNSQTNEKANQASGSSESKENESSTNDVLRKLMERRKQELEK